MFIAYDSQIFRLQRNGGISKYFVRLIENLHLIANDVSISLVAGITQNEHLLNSKVKYYGLNFETTKRKFIYNRYYNFSDSYNQFIERKILSRNDVDIVHQTYNGYELFKNKKAKTVITIHDLIYEKYPNNFEDTEDYLKRKKEAIRNADHIICVSKHTQNDFLSYYDIDKNKTSVVYHGVDKVEADGKRMVNEPYVLFVGKRGGYKNFEKAIKAFSASKLVKDFKFVCFGGGHFNKHETNLISSLGLGHKILMVSGSDSFLASLYQNAFLLLYPSIYEGFGLPVLEAMTNNCPVICSNGSSLPEVTNNAALLIDSSNIDAIIDGLNKIYENNHLRNELIKLGNENVSKFSWNKTAKETLNVYKRLI